MKTGSYKNIRVEYFSIFYQNPEYHPNRGMTVGLGYLSVELLCKQKMYIAENDKDTPIFSTLKFLPKYQERCLIAKNDNDVDDDG